MANYHVAFMFAVIAIAAAFVAVTLYLIYFSKWGIYGNSNKQRSVKTPEQKTSPSPSSPSSLCTLVFAANEDGQLELKWSDGTAGAAMLWFPLRFDRRQSLALAQAIIRNQKASNVDSDEC